MVIFRSVCVCVSRPAPEAEKTRADQVEKWGHDLYVEEEQKPREDWEKEKVSLSETHLSLSISLSLSHTLNNISTFMSSLFASLFCRLPPTGRKESKLTIIYLKNALNSH